MKRRDLLAKLRNHAKAIGQEYSQVEGGDHTKVTIGGRFTTVPRHSEINEMTARAILKQMGVRR